MWAHQGLENVTRVILSYVSVVQTACKEKVDIQRYSWSIFVLSGNVEIQMKISSLVFLLVTSL